jgi:hypothetical protein
VRTRNAGLKFQPFCHSTIVDNRSNLIHRAVFALLLKHIRLIPFAINVEPKSHSLHSTIPVLHAEIVQCVVSKTKLNFAHIAVVLMAAECFLFVVDG